MTYKVVDRNKCGVVKLVSKCMPAICIKICCPRNEITNNVTPHVVTYVPIAPPQTGFDVTSAQGLVEQHLVKLRRKS